MMSGLEINTTFVSYIKTSMYLTGMSREELYAEAYKDLIAISTPMNMFIDKVCKKATMICESSGKSVSLFALIKSELINTPDYGICIIRKKVAAIRHDELCGYSS